MRLFKNLAGAACFPFARGAIRLGIVCIEGGCYGSDIPRLHYASLALNSFRILLLKHLHIYIINLHWFE